MEEKKLSLKRKRVMTYFIEAAEKLIREEGSDGLSIRKIANEAGYNSATLYNYFEDLEDLTLFASVRYLREYVVMLSKELKEHMTALEKYRCIYHCFNTFSFREPEIFHNMFFGRHSERLEEVLRIYYYELFPAELEGLDRQMREMLCSGTMYDRDWIIMKDLIKEGFVAEEKAEKTIDIMIAVHQNYIYEAMLLGDKLNIEEHLKKFEALFDYIMEAAH